MLYENHYNMITNPDSGRFVNGQSSYVAESSEYLLCNYMNS